MADAVVLIRIRLKYYDRKHVIHRHHDRQQHRHRAGVRAVQQALRDRYADNGEIGAVDSLYHRAALAAVPDKQLRRYARQPKGRQHTENRVQQQPRADRVCQIRIIHLLEHKHGQEYAEYHLIHFLNVLAVYKPRQTHDEAHKHHRDQRENGVETHFKIAHLLFLSRFLTGLYKV